MGALSAIVTPAGNLVCDFDLIARTLSSIDGSSIDGSGLRDSGGRVRQSHRIYALGLVLAAALFVGGCQSDGAGEVLDVKAAEPAQAEPAARPGGPAVPVETIGSGPVAITLIAPRSVGEPFRTRAQDAVDGARLAANDLGAGQLRITVQDSVGNPATAKTQAEQAAAGGARFIIGPADAASIAAIGTARLAVPVLALSTQGARENVYTLGTDDIDSAVEGARAAIAAGQKTIVVLYPQELSAGDRERVRRGVARLGGQVVGEVMYPAAPTGIAAAIAGQKVHFGRATAALILGAQPAAVAQAIVGQGFGNNIAALIGSSAWPQAAYAVPLLDGAIVALPERKSFEAIAARYRAATGRAMTVDAAAAYDSVALGAGISRQSPQGAIRRQMLTGDSGFLGSLGMFRLRNDGSVERRHAIYRLQGGKPVLVQERGQGF